MLFDWDGGNEHHIAAHRVAKAEVEEALLDPLGQLVDFDVDDYAEVRYRHLGATLAGRILTVAFTMGGEVVRPITAFDAGSYVARLYRQGGKP